MKKFYILLAVAVAALASSCSSGDQQSAPQAVQVVPYTVAKSDCVVEYSYPATLEGVLDVAIYPQVNGRITKINVIQGNKVKKGDVLFEIDDVPYKAAYDQALAKREVALSQVAAAKLTLESKQRLYDNDVISEYQLKIAKIDLMTAEASLSEADAAVKDAQNSLSFTKVRTMSNGVAGQVPYKVGSLVGSNITEPLTMISDNTSIIAEFSIPEKIFLEIAQLDSYDGNIESRYEKMPPLTLLKSNGVRYEQQGKVQAISGIISQQTGALPVRAIFPNGGGQLLSGGSCKVIIPMTEKDALTVPRASIKEIQNKMFVFKIQDGKAKQVEVNAYRYNEDLWILLPDASGNFPVNEGDVISSSTNRLRNDIAVEIKSN